MLNVYYSRLPNQTTLKQCISILEALKILNDINVVSQYNVTLKERASYMRHLIIFFFIKFKMG